MAQIQLQLEVMDYPMADFACYFHKSETLKVWRIYRSKPYWKWLLPRLQTFIECIESNRQPTPDDIPYIYYESINLAKSNYDFTSLGATLFPRRVFPPRCHYELMLSQTIKKDQLGIKAPLRLRKLLIRIFFIAVMVLLIMSYVPVVH